MSHHRAEHPVIAAATLTPERTALLMIGAERYLSARETKRRLGAEVLSSTSIRGLLPEAA